MLFAYRLERWACEDNEASTRESILMRYFQKTVDYQSRNKAETRPSLIKEIIIEVIIKSYVAKLHWDRRECATRRSLWSW